MTLTAIPPYPDAQPDPGLDDEPGLFGEDEAGPRVEPEPEPAPAAPRKPGPKPDPNSARQKKLAAAARRAKTQQAPQRKAKPNTTTSASTPANEVWQRGALSLIGWVTRPLAVTGFGLGVASQNPRMAPAERAKMAFWSQALTLDSLTVGMHADALAEGAAELAPELPWLQRVLESSAKIGPYAKLGEAGIAIVVQVLCNHGIIPPMAALGTLAPDELAAAAGVPMDGPPAE